MNRFRRLFVDWEVNRGDPRIQTALVLFRLCHALRTHRDPRYRLAGKLPSLLYLVLVEWTWGIELPWATDVGDRLRIWHGTGLVVHGDTILGESVTLHQNVCLGALTATGGSPIIDDHVLVGAGAIVLGEVRVREYARIGAGAVVLSDVPPGRTAVGNPAHLI